jgi:hypothetical protein
VPKTVEISDEEIRDSLLEPNADRTSLNEVFSGIANTV